MVDPQFLTVLDGFHTVCAAESALHGFAEKVRTVDFQNRSFGKICKKRRETHCGVGIKK